MYKKAVFRSFLLMKRQFSGPFLNTAYILHANSWIQPTYYYTGHLYKNVINKKINNFNKKEKFLLPLSFLQIAVSFEKRGVWRKVIK